MIPASPKRRILAAQITALLAPIFAAHAVTAEWTVDANGSWGTASSWTGGVVPGGVDDVANFINDISAARTVTLDGTRTIGTLRIGDANSNQAFTLTGVPTGGSLVFDVTSGDALLDFSNGGGIGNTLTVPIVLNDDLRIAVTGASTGTHVLNGVISGEHSVTIDANNQAPANGLGQVTLAGFNTFSGGLTFTQVRVQTPNVFALGTGTVTVNDTGQIFATGAGTYTNDLILNGLGWQESTGLLGALRSDVSSIFNGNIAVVASGAAPITRFHTHSTGTITNVLNGVVGGDANVEFTKGATDGSSTWVLAKDAVYTGTTTIGFNAGTGTSVLQLGNGGTTGALHASSAVTINSGGVLAFNRSDELTFSNAVTGAGGVTVSGTGTVIWNNTVSGYTGPTVVNGNGRLVFGTGGAYTFTGAAADITLSNGGDLEFNTSSDVNLSGTLTGAANSHLVARGTGIVTLTGATDNPNVRVMADGGTIVLGKATAATVHAVTAANDFAVVVNGGTVSLGGSGGDQIGDASWVQLNGGIFDLAGQSETIAALQGEGGIIGNSGSTPATLTIGANNAGTIFLGNIAFNATYGGSIQDAANSLALTKTGTGLHTLSGANTYTGTTTISSGTLSITGSLAASGAVAVNNGGTLSGTGSVGNVTLVPGSTLRPGATNVDNAVGTLNAATLTVTGGDLRFNLGTASDHVEVAGTANFTGTSSVTATFSATPVTTTLLTAGSVLGTLPTLNVPGTTRSTFALANVGAGLVLEVSGPTAQALTWSGTTDGNWNLNATSNFNGGAEKFFNLDSVTFADGPANRVVTLGAGLTPTHVTVNNSAGNDYTFQTGSIAGAGGISKTGNGTLILSTANTFSGDVSITGGILRAGNAGALGDTNGATFISNGGTFDFNAQNMGAERFFIAGTGVNGAGAMINSGAQQINAMRFLTLTGDATVGGTGRFDVRAAGGGEILDLGGFTLTKTGTAQFSVVGGRITDGNILVNQGNFAIESNVVVQGTGTMTWNPGTTAQFYQTAAANVTRPMIVNGATVTNLGQLSGLGSNITLAGNSTFNANANVFTLTGDINETGGARGITKVGDNTLLFTGNVNYTGQTTVSGGTLQIGNGRATAAPDTSNIHFTGGSLNYNLLGNLTLPNVTFAGGATLRWLGASQDSTMAIAGTFGAATNIGNLTVSQGTAVLEAGASVTVNTLLVGFTSPNTNNIGTLNILPGASVTTQFFRLGDNAGFTGLVNQTGGSVTVTGVDTTDANGDAPLRIGHWPAQGSRYAISAGSLSVPNGSIDIGTDGNSPVLDISGTAAVSVRRIEVDGRNVTGPFGGFLYLRDGSLSVGEGGMTRANNGAGNSSVNISGGILRSRGSATWAVPLNFENQAAQLDTGVHNVFLSGSLVGAGAPTKVGTGTLTLSAVGSNFGGVLQVNEGGLHVTGGLNGTGSAVLNVGTVLSGTGNGSTTGRLNNLVLNSGASMRPGASALDAAVGTLTATTFDFDGGNGRFTLNPVNTAAGGAANDLLIVTGATTFDGGTITPVWSSTPQPGTYTLISSGAVTVNTLPSLDPAVVSRQTYGLAVAGNDLTLNVTGAAANLLWNGGLGGNAWDLNNTKNWQLTTPNDEPFLAYDNVTFDDTGLANANVNLTGMLLPGLTLVASDGNYTFSGNGSIAGGSLMKSGFGTLTLVTNNSYPGTTTISAGVLRVGAGGTTGSLGSGPAVNDSIVAFSRTDDVTVSNSITGAGGLQQFGGNTVTLDGANAYTGGTLISKGTILLAALGGAGTGPVFLGDLETEANAVAFLSTNGVNVANSITVNSGGTGTATIGTIGGTTGTTFSGPIELQRATTLQGQDTNFTGFSGKISGAVGVLTVSGGRRVVLQNSTNDFTGDIVVSGAGTVLQAALAGGAPGTIPSSSRVTVEAGTTFQLGFTADGAETIKALDGAGTVQLSNATAGTHTLILGNENGSGAFSGVTQNGTTAALSLTKIGSGTQVLSGAVNSTGSITLQEGVLAFGAAFGGGATRAALATDTALDSTLTLGPNLVTSDLAIGMSVSGTGVPAGSRITSIPTNNTVTIGGVQTATLAGNLTFGPAPMLLRGGTFRYLGAARTDDRLINVGLQGGALDVSGSGALTLSANTLAFDGSGPRTLVLNGTSTAANTLAAVISDSGGPTSLLKSGPGTWVLSGPGSTYSGGVTVTEGVLRLGTNNRALGENFVATITGSGTLDLNSQTGATATRRYDLVASGSGAPGLAAIWNSGGGVVNNPIYRSITLEGDTTIGGIGRYDMNGGNVDGNGVAFNGGEHSLIKVGTNELWWAPTAGATVGHIFVTAGRFGVQSSNNLGSLDHQIFVNPGGQLSSYATQTNAKPITMNGGQLHNNSAGGVLGSPAVWTGTVTLADAVNTVNTDSGAVGGPIVLNGKVTGPGGFEKIGPGFHLELGSPDNDWLGDTRVNVGTLRIAGAGRLSPNSTLDLNGGTVNLNATAQISAGLKGTSGSILGGGSLTVNQTANTTFAGAIAETTSLIKTGTGALALTGTSTTTGSHQVAAGTLVVNGTLSGTTAVIPDGQLSGSGTLGILNLEGGVLAPGEATGVLTASAVTFNGGAFAVELNGTTPGLGYDQLRVTSSFNFDAPTELVISLGYTPAANDSFVLVDNLFAGASSLGSVFTINGDPILSGEDFVFAGQAYRLDYQGGTDGNDILLIAVPEPGSALLVLGGLALCVTTRRSRRRS